MIHHFTVDVEEYFQVAALSSAAPPETWNRYPSRVVESTLALAELMEQADARGTMFVLGCVAVQHPALVKELAARGHEIASHGWAHRRVTSKTPEQFRLAVRRTKDLLEDLTGRPVYGYRAPSFSIIPGYEWALDTLLEEGYRYDSSLFPIRRYGYGYRGGNRDPHWLERSAGALGEVPPATLRIAGVNVPAGGGAYFRLLPFRLLNAAFVQAEQRAVPATFYMHPWEIDAAQPRLPVGPLTRLRHYGGLEQMQGRVRRLLATYRFRPIADSLALPLVAPVPVPERVPETAGAP